MTPEGCRICGAPNRSRLFERDGFAYALCECGAAGLDPPPDAETAAAAFPDEYFDGGGAGGYLDYDGEAAARVANARRTLAATSGRLGAPGRIVDVGAASGWLLAEAAAAGWDVAGVEVNPTMRARAAARLGPGAVLAADIAALDLADGWADAVTMVQVLEHLADPVGALREAHRLLRPGGVLVVETWDRGSFVARRSGVRWQQVTPPSVVWLFDRPSLTAMLTVSGFTFVDIRRGVKRVGLGSVFDLVAQKAPRPAAALARRALRNRRIRNATLPYALGDLVVVRATRP